MTNFERVALLELCRSGFVRVEFRELQFFGYRVSPVKGSEDGQRLLNRLKDLGYAKYVHPFPYDRGDHGWCATEAGYKVAGQRSLLPNDFS